MKLLAIVTDEIRKFLIHNLSCEIVFQRSWQQIDPATVYEYDFIIASGALVESPVDPLVLWSVASTIRYFNATALFVDLSGKAAGTIAKVYPQIKLLSYNGDGNQFILQLRTCVPQLFFDDPKYRNSTLSASANAQRFEMRANSSVLGVSGGPHFEVRPAGLRKKPVSQLTGSRSYSSSELKVQQPTAVTGSFEPVSSIPLGLKKSPTSQGSVKKLLGSNSLADVPKAKAPTDSSEARDCFEFLNDISSISSISNISSVPDALDKALQDSADGVDANTGTGPSQNGVTDRSEHQPSMMSRSAYHTIVRSLDDIRMGNVEFGNIINVLQTIHQLEATGILEIRNETRCVRVEFRKGQPYVVCSPSVLLSAMGWTSGEYTFDTTKMLSQNAQPIDLRLLFANAAQEQLSLNPLLQALEKKFNSYVVLTNVFSPQNHTENTGMWWKLCDGNTRFSEIMMRCEVAMDVISRDIFLAWLCDEICFLKNPANIKIRVEYTASGSRAGFSTQPSMRAQRSSIPERSAQDIQVQMIRKQLTDLRDSFSIQSGYSLLGIQRGCGIKALDAAYYAWINQYHADRFVRYNDHECVKLANELLMLMNSSYAKLAKVERANAEMPAHSASDSHIEVSPRIGAGRARISTLNTSTAESSKRLRAVSNELKAIQANEDKQRKQESPSSSRNPIRPASSQQDRASDGVSPKNEQSTAQFVKMSDLIAQREAAKKARNEASRLAGVDVENADSRLNVQKASRISEQATPEQLFATAQKKLKLGLSYDAFQAIDSAYKLEPDNEIYKVYHAYTSFLINPSNRDEAIEIISVIAHDLRDRAKFETKIRDKVFAPYYFLGKLYLAAERYDEANEALSFASKLDPSDIDTQRSLRYIAMQIEKRQIPEAKGFFARLKDKLST